MKNVSSAQLSPGKMQGKRTFKCRVYTESRLEKINRAYLLVGSRQIEHSDVQFANRCIKMMHKGLEADYPKVGDFIQYTSRDGIYYPHAHIDNIENGVASVCLNAFIPFVTIRDDKIIFTSVSGGPWAQIPEETLKGLKKTGAESKWFRFFSDSGFCSHGSIDFEGYANCWEYKEENLLFGEYSTKQYDRTVLRKIDDKWRITESTNVSSIPEDFQELEQWVQEVRGVLFGNFDTDDTVTVFTYKEVPVMLTLKQWQMLELPQSMRRINGRSKVFVKLLVDDDTKTVKVCRYANN